MIVKRILLENWSIFRGHKELELAEGLNLLIGPNESGKSILADALRLALFDKHTLRSARIRQLVPWGSALCPSISVIFETHAEQFRITKKFLRNVSSVLEKNVGRNWQKIGDGDDADKKVIDLVGGKIASRESKPENWGMGQVLWARQGEIFPQGELNEDVKKRIQSTFGAIIATQEEAKIKRKIDEKFYEVLTPSRRDFRSGSELDNLVVKVQELNDAKVKLEQELRDREKLVREIVDAQEGLSEKESNLDDAKKALEAASEKMKKANEHEKDREGIESDVKVFEGQYRELNERIRRIESSEKESKEGERQIGTKEKQIQEEQTGLDEIVEQLSSKQAEIKELKRNLSASLEQLAVARQVWGILRDSIDFSEQQHRLKKALELEEKKRGVKADLNLLKAPTEAEIDELRRLKGNVDRKRAQLDAIGLTARLITENEAKGIVLLDGQRKDFELSAGSFEEWKAAQKISLKLQNLAEFQVKSGSGDVQKMKEELDKLERAYSDKTAVYETSDLADLERKARARINLEGQLGQLDRQLIDLVGKSSDELEKQVKALKQHIETAWTKVPDDSALLKYKARKDSEEARKEIVRTIDSLEEEVTNLQGKEKKLSSQIEGLQGKQGAQRDRIAELNSSLQRLEGRLEQIGKEMQEIRNDGLTDEERQRSLEELGYELERKKKTLNRLQEEKEETEDKPKETLQEAEQRFGTLRQIADEARNDLSSLQGQLQERSKEGTYGDVAVTEEDLQDLQERQEKLMMDVWATELLYDLCECHRRQITESVKEPLTRIVSGNLQRLIGPKYGSVRLDDNFLPDSVEVPDWGIEVNLEPLSYGTKEQLAFLTRLALGEVLSKDERQLVILDDPLTNTHISRLKPALEILREASKRLQLMVLTCHPSQYSELADMNVLQM